MQTVNIDENKKIQKNIINEFTLMAKEGHIFSNNIFMLINRIINLECEVFNIIPEVKEKNNVDLYFNCDYSIEKDIVFYIDSEGVYKKYFYGRNIKLVEEGIFNILFDTYCQLGYAIQLMKLNKSYLSSTTLDFAKERFLQRSLDEDFLINNKKNFYSNYYVFKYAYDKLKNILDEDKLEKIKERNRDNFIYSILGKIKYKDRIESKEYMLDTISEMLFENSENVFYEFPIFEKIYNLDGTKKSLEILFEEMNNELKKISYQTSFHEQDLENLPLEYFDCKHFYYELILPQLEYALEDEYNKLSKIYGVLEIQSLLADMEKYFNDKFQVKLEYANKINNENIESLEEVKNELKRIINIIVRFRNGVEFNPIAEKLLREGGFIRGTREILYKEELKRRELFANSLIGVYDVVESESDYRSRAENEKNDIDEVVNAMYYNRFDNIFNNIEASDSKELEQIQILRVAQILKIVKIISDTIKIDCLKEFLTIPDINRLMIKLEKDDTGFLRECMFKTRLRFKKVIYPETEAENGKYRDYILGNELLDGNEEIGIKINMVKEEIMDKARK